MQGLTPPNSAPNNDRQHLKYLAIGHYVYAGLTVAFSLISIAYFGFIWMFLNTPQITEGNVGAPSSSAAELGIFFAAIMGFTLIFSLIYLVCLVIAGRCLSRRKGYWFTFVVAILECFSVPFGTALGVLTIVVLMRDSVKVLYGLKEPAEQSPMD
jgi:hypothetical protein